MPRERVLAVFATAPVLDADRFRADRDAAADQDPFAAVPRPQKRDDGAHTA